MGYQLNLVGMVCSLVILSVLAIIMNFLCIYIIRTSKNLKNRPSSLFVLNLLLVHLFQGTFVLPLYLGKKLGKLIPSFLVAKIVGNGYRFTYILSFYGTCLGVLSIALDRFLATYLITRYKTLVTAKRVCIYLMFLWIYILGLSVVPFIDPKLKDVPISISANNTINGSYVIPRLKFYYYNPQRVWVVFMLFVNATVPYFLIILIYIYIVFRLKHIEAFKTRSKDTRPTKNKRLVVESADTEKQHQSSSQLKHQAILKYKEVSYFTLALAVAYGICWSPSIINYILWSICETCFPSDYQDSKVEKILGFTIKYLANLNALISPIIYCFYHSEFRKSYLEVQDTLLKSISLSSTHKTDGVLASALVTTKI